MPLNVSLLRQSFAMVVERQPLLARRFYEVLFTRFPQARHLFGRHDGATQERMLTTALVAVMDHLEDAPWLKETLGGLGARHVGYGVTPEMYGWVGAALLETLAEVAGPEWSGDLHAAWADAYGAIAGLMLTGGAESAKM